MLFTALLLKAADTNANTDLNNNWQPFSTMSVQLFLPLFILVLILVAAYFLMKYLRPNFRKGKNLETMESMMINQMSSVRLIRVGKKYFLIGVTKDRISFLSEVDENSIDNDYTSVDGMRPPDIFGNMRGMFKANGKKQDDDE